MERRFRIWLTNETKLAAASSVDLSAVALALITSVVLGLNGQALAGGLIGGGGLVGLAAVFVVGNLYRKTSSPGPDSSHH